MASEDDDGPNPLGPARPLVAAALRLGRRAGDAGDPGGAAALLSCAARLARKVRGLSEVADFRLERALDEADNETDPAAQSDVLLDALESLLEDLEPDAPPADPLAAVQGLIGQAISIGAPAYNTGDKQGCFDVYAATARAVLATVKDVPEPAATRLREALDKCQELDDPDAQAWAMRHAFDAVGEMGDQGGGADVGPRAILALMSMAISIGAPAFNAGDHRGCYEVYACTARLLANSPATPEPAKMALRAALAAASIVQSASRQAWTLREAFDALLGAATGRAEG